MDAILLVGGFGTRLQPLIITRPKLLILLANMPFVERSARWLCDAGIDHIILNLHYNAEQFMSYFVRLSLPTDYLQAHRDILSRIVHIPLAGKEVTPGVWMEDGVSITESAVIRLPIILGQGVTIAAGATDGPTVVLGSQVAIGEDAMIEDSVIWDRTYIHRYAIVQGSILGRGCEISGTVQEQICENYTRIASRRRRLKTSKAA